MGGVDWLELSWYGVIPEATLKALEDCKRAAQSGNADRSILGTFLDQPMVVADGAAKSGGLMFPYRIQWQGVQLLVRRSRLGDDNQVCRVVMPGKFLTAHGHQAAYESVKAIAAWLGIHLVKELVSRVDLCADLLERIQEASRCFDWNNIAETGHLGDSRVVSRARDFRLISSDGAATVYVQSQDVKCRIYDKRATALQDVESLQLMVERRWCGKLPDAATRVEFQLGRDVLRDRFNVQSFGDLLAALPRIWHWLTHEWLRLTDVPPDRDNNHQDRCEASTFWRAVIACGRGWINWQGKELPPIAKPDVKAKQKHLLRMEPGVASSLAALSSMAFESVADVHRWFDQRNEELKSFAGVMLRNIKDKRLALRALTPAALLSFPVPST